MRINMVNPLLMVRTIKLSEAADRENEIRNRKKYCKEKERTERAA
jgi:hypothetical protein